MATASITLSTSRATLRAGFGSWAWHASGLAAMIFVGSWIAWSTPWFWEYRREAWYLPALVAAEYLVAVGICFRFSRFPQASRIGAPVLSLTIAHLLGVSFIALARLYYSRSFLLVGYGVGLLWILAAANFWVRRVRNMRLAVVPGGFSSKLMELNRGNWRLLDRPEHPPEVDAVSADLHSSLEPLWVRFIADSTLQGMLVYHSAALYEALTGRVSLDHHSDGVLEDFQLPAFYGTLKRVGDLLVVFLSLPVVLPVLVVTAILIRLESRGPVLFFQERVGQRGGTFRMVKFRSMRIDSESQGAKFAGERDDRVTRIGRFIRKFRIDELPQFWNILKGEMSLIGPRPEQISFARQFEREIPYYVYRHLVKPGLTGWAQVNQGYAAEADQHREKIEHDLFYIKHVSFSLDLLIVIKTVRTILTGFGAR